MISHVVFDMIFVSAIVRTRLGYFDRGIEEAAADLGAGPVRTFVLDDAPGDPAGRGRGSARGLHALDRRVRDRVLQFGPTSITFPIKVYAMIRFGVTPEINAVAAIVMAGSLVMIVVALRLTRPKGAQGTRIGPVG